MLAFTGISSYSYLQDMDAETNSYTVGNNDCLIQEKYTKPTTLVSGTKVSKDVKVKNTGTVPCYIRLYVKPSYKPESFTFNMNSDTSLTGSKDWYQSGDWYYYKKPVSPGSTTSSLFTTVTLKENMTKWAAEDLKIIMYAESIQSSGATDAYKAFN